MKSPDQIDTARAQEWALLAMLLARAPDAELMGRLARLRGDSSPLGVAHAALGEAAARVGLERAGREYFDLFVGVGRGELLPYASYYLTGFLYERPLARLRADLNRLGIARAEGLAEKYRNRAQLAAEHEIGGPGACQRKVDQIRNRRNKLRYSDEAVGVRIRQIEPQRD